MTDLRADAIEFDLPAVYHEHDGPTEHRHKAMGPGHYSGETGHFHLTEVRTAAEIGDLLRLNRGDTNSD